MTSTAEYPTSIIRAILQAIPIQGTSRLHEEMRLSTTLKYAKLPQIWYRALAGNELSGEFGEWIPTGTKADQNLNYE